VALPGEPQSPDAWDQIREQGRQQLCWRLARAQLELGAQPELSLRLGQQLARELPARPEPWLLQARAQARLGAFPAAWPLWEEAQKRGEDLRAAHVLHDYAVTAAMTGRSELALASYHKLLPLLQAWPDPIDQQAIYLEAAAAAQARGPEGLDEAAGHLAGARARATSTGLRAVVAGMGALLAARRGAAPESEPRLVAPEVWRFVEAVQSERWPRRWPALPPHEVFGAAALLVEPYSDVVSAQLWQRHAEGLQRAAAPEAWRALAARPPRADAPRTRRAP
jgi:tetratricopeptide (TPR) repeat protein